MILTLREIYRTQIKKQQLKFSNAKELFSINYRKVNFDYLALIAYLFLFLGSFIDLLEINELNKVRLISATGAFLSFFSLARYFQTDEEYSDIYDTILLSTKKVGSFLLGCFPIWVAFVILGHTIFNETQNFQTIERTMITLFCLTFSDNILNLISEVRKAKGYFGILFIVFYIVLVVFVILNVMTAVVGECYFAQKQAKENKNMLFNRKVSNDLAETEDLNEEQAKRNESKRYKKKQFTRQNGLNNISLDFLNNEEEDVNVDQSVN